MRISILLSIFLLVLPLNIFAQERADVQGGMYFKFGAVHAEGQVEWADYLVNGLNFEIENYFSEKHGGISGWSVGYRKDDTRYSEFGHMLNLKVFRTFEIKFVEAKLGGGAEWGLPAHGFDKTRYSEAWGNIYYDHVGLKRNSNIPKIGTTQDGTLYPSLDLSILKRNRFFLVETGVRANIMKFQASDYVVSGGKLSVSSRSMTRVVPYFFVNIGVGLWVK